MLAGIITRTGFEQKNAIDSRASLLKVTTHTPEKVVVDGEIIGTTPIEVKCIPAGLTVLAPNLGKLQEI